jgi:putative lipoic acid-binding regulatory protein
MDKKLEEFFERLRGELADSTTWPSIYLFKFIVPTDPAKIKAVEDAFDQLGAVINTTESRNGKFTSVSVNVQMISPDQVIEKYKEVSTIEGIVSL